MNLLTITAFYLSLLLVMQVVYTLHVIRARIKGKVPIGHGDNKTLLRRIRGHANFTETVPIMLFALALLEWQQQPGWLLHSLGAALLIARALHYAGMVNPAVWHLRRAGMVTTLLLMLIAAVLLMVGNVPVWGLEIPK